MQQRVIEVVGRALDLAGEWEELHGHAPDVDFVSEEIHKLANNKYSPGSERSRQLNENAQDLFILAARDVTGIPAQKQR